MRTLDRAVERAARAYGRRTRAPMPERTDRACLRARVGAAADLCAGLRRITLHAPELATFTRCGSDEYVGLLMPRPGTPLRLPDPGAAHVRAGVAAMPEAKRPDLRWYTIRAHRPQAAEVDLDIVTHGTSGPGSAWALRTRPGDEVGVHTGGALYLDPGDDPAAGPGPRRELLVADETALPGLAAIVDAWEGSARGPGAARSAEIHVEVPDAALADAYELPAGTRVHVRGAGAPGSAVRPALAALAAERRVDAFGYAWVCGEAGTATGVRRDLVEAGLDRRRIVFSGFWKRGQARG